MFRPLPQQVEHQPPNLGNSLPFYFLSVLDDTQKTKPVGSTAPQNSGLEGLFVFPKISELRKHIQIIGQCSKRQAAKAATLCLKDGDYAISLLGIELYHDLFGDPTGEQATNNVLKEQVAV